MYSLRRLDQYHILYFHWIVKTDFMKINEKTNKLQASVVFAVTGLRIIAGLSSLLNRWRKRNQLIQIIEYIFRFSLDSPEYKRSFRWCIFSKILSTFAFFLLHVAQIVQIMIRMHFRQNLWILLLSWTFCITNLAVLQYFLILFFVRTRYKVINDKLQEIIRECERLSCLPQRDGAFVTRCSYLSSELESIAKLQDQVYLIVTRFGEVLGIQTIAVFGEFYMTSVSFGYLIYSILKYGTKKLNFTPQSIFWACSWSFLYNLNGFLNITNIMYTFDDHKKTNRLLGKRTLFASRLDVCLEKSFESFQLQLVRNPLKVDVMGMFLITQSSIAAMLGSVLMYTILLIQYDLEHF